MRSLILESPKSTPTWVEIDQPMVSANGVLIRPTALATCDFDHLMYSGKMPMPGPISLGHEFVGEVIEVGKDVSRFKMGNKVIVPFQISCGACPQCKSGHSSSCTAVEWLSCFGLGPLAGDWGGATSDVVAVPYADAMLLPLPDNLAEEHAACLSCNIPDALRCVIPQLKACPGAPVLIVGGAFDNIAFYSALMAKLSGSIDVDVIGVHPAFYEKIEKAGARVLANTNEVRTNHYPVVVDAGMNKEYLNLAIEAAAPSGIITISTMYTEPLTPMPMMKMFEKCLRMEVGQPHARSELEDSLQLLLDHQGHFALAIDGVLPWEEADKAFSSGSGKLVVKR